MKQQNWRPGFGRQQFLAMKSFWWTQVRQIILPTWPGRPEHGCLPALGRMTLLLRGILPWTESVLTVTGWCFSMQMRPFTHQSGCVVLWPSYSYSSLKCRGYRCQLSTWMWMPASGKSSGSEPCGFGIIILPFAIRALSMKRFMQQTAVWNNVLWRLWRFGIRAIPRGAFSRNSRGICSSLCRRCRRREKNLCITVIWRTACMVCMNMSWPSPMSAGQLLPG